ncbi:thiamine pyrophosphate-dependent enzyme [Nitrosopumilus sp.]|uniref:thiamine pyrophosphate-dependent enzyme n=1 Tax=Nitrosopumilus sp. TaxID=2024843 RepID=UPI00247E9005|nr:thiamine pyrophosphate-dependent enzyme [Nitrosopumilus sp.]MCV0430393.1 hypothetical protein [Nitrosopumilus sp.]
MIRKEAIEIIGKFCKNNPIVSANGFISRDLYDTCEKKSNFYMIGSMGLASSIGLGIALTRSKKKIYVFDGDGNILMNLGSLTTIGKMSPKNLIHVIFDNSIHESTGGQPTHTSTIKIEKIAKACGYTVYKTSSKEKLIEILNKKLKIKSPIMILIKIQPSKIVSSRVMYKPTEIKKRFMKAI